MSLSIDQINELQAENERLKEAIRVAVGGLGWDKPDLDLIQRSLMLALAAPAREGHADAPA